MASIDEDKKEDIEKESLRDKLDKKLDKVVTRITNLDEDTGDPLTPAEEKISNNAKKILLALFAMISFVVTLGTAVLIVKPDVSTEVLTIIFSTAITGAFTLGGVLINAIWGK